MQELLQININPSNDPLTSASVPVTWCLTEEGKKHIIENQYSIDDMYVLFISVKHTKEYRQIFKLSDYAAYIDFYNSGDCTLHVILIHKIPVNNNPFLSKFTKIKDTFLSKSSYSDFRYNILTHSKRFIERTNYKSLLWHKSIEINIPNDVFAKEPPKFILDIVNSWHDYPAKDQCQFRRRVLETIFFKGWVILGIFITQFLYITLFCTALILLGNSIKLKKIYLDWVLDLSHITHYYIDKNIFDFKLKHTKMISFYIFTPISLILIWLFVEGSIYSDHPFLFFKILGAGFLILLSIDILRELISRWDNKIVINFLDRILSKLNKMIYSINFFEFSSNEKKSNKAIKNEDIVMCTNKTLSFDDLPKEKKTLKLKAMKIKAKICKPMPKY